MWRVLACLILIAAGRPAVSCDLALVLAVDVSGSVDHREYRVQMDGLAAALRDGVVAEALVAQRAMVTLVQWTGSSRQRQSLPWTEMASFAAVETFAGEVESHPRVWRNYSTAIGEAVAMSQGLLRQVPQCRRMVIDVSGDGRSNEGSGPEAMRTGLREAGIIVNAVAIETDDFDLTAYFFEHLITGDGAFVETAMGFQDYPRAIRRKLIRETSRASAGIEDGAARPVLAAKRDHR